MFIEPILDNKERESLYPIENTDIWNYYNNHMSTFWTAREIDLAIDVIDWDNKLNDNEKRFIETILGFFSTSDFIVVENLTSGYIDKIKLVELKMYYRYQASAEDVHSTVYADLINTFVRSNERKLELFNSISNIPVIAKKAEWCRNYIFKNTDNPTLNFIYRLIVFAIVEGIFFSSSFCSIYWLKKRGLMPGLTFSNELISRDEGLHRDVACYIYRELIVNKIDNKIILDIVSEAVEIEKQFVNEALKVDLIGMNSKLMNEYVEYVSDHFLMNLIGLKLYNTKNPFDWMELISLEGKTNFFEKRVGEYSKSENGKIIFDSEF